MFWANLRLTLSGAQSRISTIYNEFATPAYELFDVECGIEPFKNFKIGLAGLNIFNKYYVNHLTFAFNNIDGFGRVPIPEPGRNLTVFASYRF
jgi:iron complex outermembrane receptor protein